MNERIVKLFMQSVDTNYIPLPIEDHIPLWTEKFAELIVRECIEINKQELAFNAFERLMNKYQDHFGVKE